MLYRNTRGRPSLSKLEGQGLWSIHCLSYAPQARQIFRESSAATHALLLLLYKDEAQLCQRLHSSLSASIRLCNADRRFTLNLEGPVLYCICSHDWAIPTRSSPTWPDLNRAAWAKRAQSCPGNPTCKNLLQGNQLRMLSCSIWRHEYVLDSKAGQNWGWRPITWLVKAPSQ